MLTSYEEQIDALAKREQQLTQRSQIEEKVDTLAKQQENSNAFLFIQWYDYFHSED